MTGAAIATAAVSVVNGIGARKDASEARDRADQESAISLAQRKEAGEQVDLAIEQIKANQINVEALEDFLSQMSQEGLDFAQGLLDQWESTFGSVEQNLSDYYKNLDPEKYAVQNKARLDEALQKSMQQFNETMAANGLQSAGMKEQAAKEAAFKQAQGNAQIDIASEDKVRGMQENWLKFGEPRRKTAEVAMGTALDKDTAFGKDIYNAKTKQNDSIVDAMINKANFTAGTAEFMQNRADKYGQSAGQSSAAAGEYFGQAMKSGLTAYNSYNNNNGLGKNPYIKSDDGVMY